MNPPFAAPAKPDAFALYTVIVLHHDGAFLLLRRAAEKRFAPGRWSGLGGRVEADEFTRLQAAAYRELHEETGLRPEDAAPLTLRRVLYHDRPGEPLTGLLYYTAALPRRLRPSCSEGSLHWIEVNDLAALDVIETTAAVLPLLAADIARDPAGLEPVRLGVAHYRSGSATAPIPPEPLVRWNEG